jgi:hypothetical protein
MTARHHGHPPTTSSTPGEKPPPADLGMSVHADVPLDQVPGRTRAALVDHGA